VLDLHRSGKSARQIADEVSTGPIKVSYVTVTRWLHDAGLEPNGGSGPRTGRAHVEAPPAAKEAKARAAETLAEAMLDVEAPLEEVRKLRARHRKVADELGRAIEEAGSTSPVGVTLLEPWGRVLERHSKLASLEQALVPPEPPDPEKDPTNIEAADELGARLAAAVKAAEETCQCVHCGKHPFSQEPSDDRRRST
jgi:hypothetical protein